MFNKKQTENWQNFVITLGTLGLKKLKETRKVKSCRSHTWYNDVLLIEWVIDHRQGQLDPHAVAFDEVLALADHQIDRLVVVEVNETFN